MAEMAGIRDSISGPKLAALKGRRDDMVTLEEIGIDQIIVEGPMEVKTRAPRALHRLVPGQRCEVAPKTAHTVHGVDGRPCKFLLMQCDGVYDNVAVG